MEVPSEFGSAAAEGMSSTSQGGYTRDDQGNH